MISLNALITPGDNSIMIVAIKLGFHQDLKTEGGKAIIPLTVSDDIACNTIILGHLAEFMTFESICNAGEVFSLTKPRHLCRICRGNFFWWH